MFNHIFCLHSTRSSIPVLVGFLIRTPACDRVLQFFSVCENPQRFCVEIYSRKFPFNPFIRCPELNHVLRVQIPSSLPVIKFSCSCSDMSSIPVHEFSSSSPAFFISSSLCKNLKDSMYSRNVKQTVSLRLFNRTY